MYYFLWSSEIYVAMAKQKFASLKGGSFQIRAKNKVVVQKDSAKARSKLPNDYVVPSRYSSETALLRNKLGHFSARHFHNDEVFSGCPDASCSDGLLRKCRRRLQRNTGQVSRSLRDRSPRRKPRREPQGKRYEPILVKSASEMRNVLGYGWLQRRLVLNTKLYHIMNKANGAPCAYDFAYESFVKDVHWKGFRLDVPFHGTYLDDKEYTVSCVLILPP